VTVVIATRDRAATLLRTLDRLAALPERPPVVVVDNASSDDTRTLVRARHPAVRLITSTRNLGAAARTVGVAEAPTPVVAFSDDDSWWEPGSLDRAAAAFSRRPRLGLLAARVVVGTRRRPDPVCAQLAAGPVLGFLACGALVRRSAYLAVGGFHPRLEVGGEEELLAIDLAAAGWDLAYDPAVVAEHRPPGAAPRPGRRRRQVRNALWVAWLRRRSGPALRRTWRAMAEAGDAECRAGLLDAARGAGWALRERRPVPRELDARLALRPPVQPCRAAR
jgi:GT2 family glycosyltransferase